MGRHVEVPLRWGDLDAQGHVNNARFIDYLQEARADFLLGGPVSHLLGGGMVVVSHQIEYLAPIEYRDEPVLVDVAVLSCGGAQIELGYRLHHQGRCCARARTRLCPYDLTEQRVRRLSGAERAWFRDQVEPAEPLRDLIRLPITERAFAAPIRVRWSDIDSYDHVNNVCFFEYIQQARVVFASRADGEMRRAAATAGEYLWLVLRQDVEYRRPLTFRTEPYLVRVGLASAGRTSLVFCSDLVDPVTGDQHATAATVVVCGDRHGTPVPLPDHWKLALQPYTLS